MKRALPSAGLRIAIKGLILFVAANLLFALANPMPWLGGLSLYGPVFTRRERLPFGYRPDRAFNLVVDNLDAMLASHAAAAPRAPGEFRVLIFGDSSIWGVLLAPGETLAGRLNALALRAPDGRAMRFYNLGYPDFSVSKDLILMRRAMALQPDLIVWAMTLNSLVRDRQVEHLLVRNNPADARALIGRYGLSLNPADPQFAAPSFFDLTLAGQRRNLADLIRLQVVGVLWSATSIDQDMPETPERLSIDLEASDAMRGVSRPLSDADALFESIAVARALAAEGGVPLAVINEPIAQSAGKNSDLRYNAFYPRWAYDQYRARLATATAGMPYLDAWNLIAIDDFTNSPVHLTPAGSDRFARAIAAALPAWLR